MTILKRLKQSINETAMFRPSHKAELEKLEKLATVFDSLSDSAHSELEHNLRRMQRISETEDLDRIILQQIEQELLRNKPSEDPHQPATQEVITENQNDNFSDEVFIGRNKQVLGPSFFGYYSSTKTARAYNSDDYPPTALVLSGGAIAGSFQVGFLAAHYSREDWDALNIQHIIGTSVGSVNGLALSESGIRGIPKLVGLYLGLKQDSDMFVKEAWHLSADLVLQTSPLNSKFLDFLGGTINERITRPNWSFDNWYDYTIGGFLIEGLTSMINAGSDAGEALKALFRVFTLFSESKGLFNFAPLRKLIRENINFVDIGAIPFSMAMVSLETGQVEYVSEKGYLIDGSPKQLDTNSRKILGDLEDIIIDAVVASSSVPILFPPVRIENYNYVDGGVREVLPTRNLTDLGLPRVIAVAASPPEISEFRYGGRDPQIMDIAQRTLNIMTTDTLDQDIIDLMDLAEDNIEPILITPSIRVIDDGFEIDPGLIRINMDYGYMVGYRNTHRIKAGPLDEFVEATLVALEIDIIELRLDCWEIEREIIGHQVYRYFDRDKLDTLRRKKIQIYEKTVARYEVLGDLKSVPISLVGDNRLRTDIHNWWASWENVYNSPLLKQYDLWSRLPIGINKRTGNYIREKWDNIPPKPPTDIFPYYLLHAGTALHETDDTWEFAVGDFNHDGYLDVFGIKKSGGETASTEVHILSGAHNYQRYLLQEGTPLHPTDHTFEFHVADFNGDGYLDLIAIKKMSQPHSDRTQVHVLSGKSRYKQWILHEDTTLHETDDTWEFAVGDFNHDGYLDVFGIKKSGGETASTEVHILSGAHNYQRYLLQEGTPLHPTDHTFEFHVADFNGDGYLDLIAIKKMSQPHSDRTQVHVLSGKSRYKQWIWQRNTLEKETDAKFTFGIGDFDRDGRLELLIVKKRETGTQSTEVHLLKISQLS